MSSPTPGWYPNPDPQGEGMRWWDGTAWAQTQPLAGPPQARPVLGRRPLLGLLVLVPVVGVVLYASGITSPGGALTKKDATVTVSADTSVCWSANIGGATQDGCGTQDFPVHDDLGIFSSTVQKRDGGPEPVTISVMVGGSVKATNSTRAAYGVASVAVQP